MRSHLVRHYCRLATIAISVLPIYVDNQIIREVRTIVIHQPVPLLCVQNFGKYFDIFSTILTVYVYILAKD